MCVVCVYVSGVGCVSGICGVCICVCGCEVCVYM